MKTALPLSGICLALIVSIAAGSGFPAEDLKAAAHLPWENSLGMRFVPVPHTQVLFSIWDTRVQDYQSFVNDTEREWKKVEFEQGPTHPAVNVSCLDAVAFSDWLTARERKKGVITTEQRYRLPSDAEWSAAVGINESDLKKGQGHAILRLKTRKELSYPWGPAWPPPVHAGNYDQSLAVDDYLYTSPVGSFAPNAFGLYDIGGNVWQWCADVFSDKSGLRQRAVDRTVGLEPSPRASTISTPTDAPPTARELDEFAKAEKYHHDMLVREIQGFKPEEWRVLRGASYSRAVPSRGIVGPSPQGDLRQLLQLSFRAAQPPKSYDNCIGFRIVLESSGP